jgi:spore coat polysaccharide biosynthesis protein SpsF
MTVGVILQARCGSRRFPRKVLLPLPYPGGPSAVEHIEARVAASTGIDAFSVATTTDAIDDELAERMRGRVFRGHPTDVLDRYHRAAAELACDAVVRLTGDNPCLMPELIDRLVSHFVAGSYDYCRLTGVPLGLHAEIFTAEALRTAAERGHDPYEREHVTPYFYRHPEMFSLGEVPVDIPEAVADARLTLDYPSDYAMLNVVFSRFRGTLFTLGELAALLAAAPWLRDVNRNFQKGDLDADAQMRAAIALLDDCELTVPAALLRGGRP